MKDILNISNTKKYITAIKTVNLLRNAVYIGVAAISVMNVIKIYKAITE